MAGQRQPMSAEVPRSRLKHTDARSSNPQVLCAPSLAKAGKGFHDGQDNGKPATSASRTIDDDAETPKKQGPNDASVPVCPKVCPNCCRTLTIADKATSDALMNMVFALQELIAQNDCDKSGKSRAGGIGTSPRGAFLEVIRLLTKMAPDERAALIGLLKALA